MQNYYFMEEPIFEVNLNDGTKGSWLISFWLQDPLKCQYNSNPNLMPEVF